ncbi:MAG: transketolase [Saprospiraceae bacterium]|nr:MAG: transketolase [Saprospiraceae bacterium]
MLNELIKTIRGLTIDAVEKANSGHPGLPMGMADVAAILWSEFLKHNPANPGWADRDRFILSAGHGSMLIYNLLHLFGYDLSMDELKNFRQWGSKTPGHPESHETPGVETTTGPLGQGIANSVGFALAETSLAARFNRDDYDIVNHYTYVIASDGDLEEGVSHEACSFAGHNKLGKLIVFYDDNNVTIDGDTELSFSEDVVKRFEGYGWHTLKIDGHDHDAIRTAIRTAQSVGNKPTIIACKTIIGFGSPSLAGKHDAHSDPFGAEEIKLTKENLGIPVEPAFFVPEVLNTLPKQTIEKGKNAETVWAKKLAAYKQAHADTARTFEQCLSGLVSEKALDIPAFPAGGAIATRSASGKVLDHLAPLIPSLMGGSADLTPSNKTLAKGETSFSPEHPTGRYIHYGVREHGMAAIMNGLSLHGGVIPFAGTFFVFTDYMRAAMRMSALMGKQVIYVLTHDSIGLGEDGPTHQPEAHLTSLRAMPNMQVIRPMDANETAEGWKMALKNTSGPTSLVLTRQNLPIYDREKEGMAPAKEASKGGYVLMEDKGFDTIIIAAGSEVEIAVNAKKSLNDQGIKVRIVSMPCTEAFDAQSADYRNTVLPSGIRKRIAIEAGVTLGWYKYVGLDGKVIGMDHYGASAPYKTIYEKFGITAEALVKAAKGL